MATLITASAFAMAPAGVAARADQHATKADGKHVPASHAANNLIASKAPQLKVGSGDRFTLVKNWTTPEGLQYAAYQRTHDGLAVHGGDFVVTTDAQGRVLNTSVGQRVRIPNLSRTPKVSAARAGAVASKQFTSGSRVGSTELVIDALSTPRLAWKVRVSGDDAKGDHAAQTVYVDANTAKIISRDSLIDFGTGSGHFNGPSPLTIATSGSTGSFTLKDPSITNLDCRDDGTNTVFAGADDAWGDGSAMSKETGCVDVLFAAQTQDKMLRNWLGRNGANGNGGAWRTRVGIDMVNAFYCGPGDVEAGYCDGTEQVRIGHNQANDRWLTPLDVVGHEFGHGIDTNTPGGLSGSGTQEFVGDVFGALTEAYANETAEFDPPDYTVGEEIDLTGNGPIRTMYNPSAQGHPNCYSSSIPNTEVHAAAGPGNHWFYLLAEGTNPVGKPTSTTCNGSTNLTGIGIQAAGKIFYNAMLQKTTGGSYLKYRTWTLNAAKNLYPGDCTNFTKVKAAWDAVSVPAQAGDPQCTVAGNTVTVTNPGSKTGTVGTAASLQLTGSSSGSGQTLTWSAIGLPAGLAINASTGLISGTPTTAGTFTVNATAKDTTGATGSASFTWTISGGGGGGGGSQLLQNAGFESGTTPWTGNTGVIYAAANGQTPRSGSKFAYFGGNGKTATESLQQSVTIPANASSATLSFWVKISTAENTTSTAYDTFKVQVIDGGTTTTKATYSNLNTTSGYVQKTVDLTAYKGKTISVKFLMNEDSSLQTTFATDDTALNVS